MVKRLAILCAPVLFVLIVGWAVIPPKFTVLAMKLTMQNIKPTHAFQIAAVGVGYLLLGIE